MSADTVDAYLAALPATARAHVAVIRQHLARQVPDGVERMSYAIPCLRRNGRTILYYGAWAHHVGVYPVAQGDAAFEALVGPWRQGKAGLHFPLDAPVPLQVLDAVLRAKPGD